MYDGTSKNSGNDDEIEYAFDCSQKAFYETFIQTGAELQQEEAGQRGLQAYLAYARFSAESPGKTVLIGVLQLPCL